MDEKRFCGKKNPRVTANPFSAVTFSYMIPLFITGLKRQLKEDDLFQPLSSHYSKVLGDKLERSWNKEIESYSKPSLWRALGRVFLVEFALFGLVLALIEFILKLAQPVALGYLLKYFEPGQKSVTKTEAYIYAGTIITTLFIYLFVAHKFMMGVTQFGMKIRIACCSLIYRKSLKLNKNVLCDVTTGQMVNLLSNDVNRFDLAPSNAHYLWITPLNTVLVLYLMNSYVGITSAAGICFLVFFMIVQIFLGKASSIFRMATAIKTDERVRLMNEIISGIQVIKMYTWEKPFAKLVDLVRRQEMQKIKGSAYVRAITFSFMIFVNRNALFLCILTYVLMGNTITAQYVYILTAFYNILQQSMTIFFPYAVTQIAEANVSIKRIETFLNFEEIQNTVFSHYFNNNKQTETMAIKIEKATSSWSKDLKEPTLVDIDLQVDKNMLAALIGPVGSGKSSLLQFILEELPALKGTLIVKGTISYASQEPWLFSGTIKQNILFGQRVNNKRYEEVLKTCVLNKDLENFPKGDETLIGERGLVLSGGQKARINLARAIYKEADIYLLDDPLSAVDTHVGMQLFEKCIKRFLRNKSILLVTHQLQYLENVDKIYLLENGKVVKSGSYSQLKESGEDFGKQNDSEDTSHLKVSLKIEVEKGTIEEELVVKETYKKGSISKDTYFQYMKAGGNVFWTITIILLFILTQVFASCSDIFIAIWVNLEQTDHYFNNISENIYLYTYIFLITATLILALIRSFAFFRFCIRASTRLHEIIFKNILNAKLLFFTLNQSGVILNRFSKDLGLLDDTFPATTIVFLQVGLTALGIGIVIAVINPWLLIPSLIMAIVFWLIRYGYICTSRNIKRLEAVTRSPVFGHINASLHGLSTIRAFRAQKDLQQEFDNLQDRHTSAWHMYISSSRAFGFWLDFLCVVYTAVVTLSFLVYENEEKSGGNVGVVITQALTLVMILQWGMREWSEFENQMTSVERIVEYTKIDTEQLPQKGRNDSLLNKFWPSNGSIQFQRVSMKYSPLEPYVLKSLSFVANSQEKIGIVGRTGAGKSSIIFALFRLVDTEGKIFIDHLDISKVSLEDLRSKISIIPQEPVLFSGTLRKNLDPFDKFDDLCLWNALEEVELKSTVQDLPQGLESSISEGGSNFSIGQRQLLCLARALMQNNKILVMDEATANVDQQTDSLIQKTIRGKFVNCTVLTIAHRLNTIMDSDKVLVMDAGNIVEFGHPYLLLQNNSGEFYKLVENTGPATASNLKLIAETNYINLENCKKSL